MTLCLSQIEMQLRATHRTLVKVATTGDLDTWTIEVPVHIRNGCNLREHWAARAKRVKKERHTVGFALWHRHLIVKLDKPALPVVVTITRLAPRALDSDNAIAGCKAVRDEIAAWLGINDNDPRVTWRYAQEKAEGYACRVSIAEGD